MMGSEELKWTVLELADADQSLSEDAKLLILWRAGRGRDVRRGPRRRGRADRAAQSS